MNLIITNQYMAYTDARLLGYQGETNARTIKVAQPHIDEATAYRLIFDCGNDVIYEVDVTDGEYIVDGGLLINIGTVKCQWQAVKLVGDTYELVAKSNIIEFEVKPSIQGDVAPIPTYEQSKSALDEVLQAAEQAQDAEAAAERAEIAAESATEAAEVAEQAKTEAEQSASAAAESATAAEQSKTAAETAAETAQQAKAETITAAETAIQKAAEAEQSAISAAESAAEAEKSSQQATDKAAEISASAEQIAENSANIEDIKAYIGYTDEDIVGLCVDYENKMFSRLAGAVGKNQGADFDIFPMYGGRRRCNVADDGTINAWYGDEDYTEDGTMGQVMVYQPAFYYKVVPLKYEPITDGVGYHLRKANYYVSTKPKTGFKRHPAFYDASGNEVDYIFLSAFEGCVFDVSAAEGSGAYILDDNQIADFTKITGDKFSSIAGAKPASGKTQNLTRQNVEIMAQNRGTGWHCDLIKPVSANQLLMIIEMGMMNSQTAIANGVVSVSDTPNTENNSIVTGGTSSLGNGTGQAEGGTNGKSSISYRGVENPWGNIWKFVYGVNIHGDGSQKGGIPYICSDFSFAESKNSDNYESAGFTVANASGYISAMGYSEEFDWLFFPSEATGNSSLPVGDFLYIISNLNGYRIARLGGHWVNGGLAGAFYWTLANVVGGRAREIGARLVYIPTTTDDSYEVNLNAWRDIMTA